jgi:hypothetical protein
VNVGQVLRKFNILTCYDLFMSQKRNISLMIALAIPVLMIIVVTASVYVPSLFARPKYNFLYLTGDCYYGQREYSVQFGRLIRSDPHKDDNLYGYSPQTKSSLFTYDVFKNTSREVAYSEMKNVNIAPGNKSPDGFEVVKGNGLADSSYLFSHDSSYNNWYLRGNNLNIELHPTLVGGDAYNNFCVLGWLKG